jgi:hypothetical protein
MFGLKGAPGQLKNGTVAQMLNCARGEGTTYSAIKEFAEKPNCTVFMLQEPWSAKNKPPPDHPDFTIFSPSTKNPKCATYIRTSACFQPLKTRSEIQIDRAKILHIRYSPGKSDLMFCFPTGSAFKNIEPDDHRALVINNERILPKCSLKYLDVYLNESL